jgi:flagella basal body P-ring formation protein FlgA
MKFGTFEKLTRLALVTAACVALAASAHGTVLKLREDASVTGDFVRLTDLAEISDASPETAASLKAIYLGSTPETGSEKTISLEQVKLELRKHGMNPQEIIFTGATETRLRRISDAQEKTSAAFRQWMTSAVLDFLRANFDTGTDEITIEFKGSSADPFDAQASGARLEGIATTAAQIGGDMQFSARIVARGGEVPVTVTACVRRYRDVLVASKALTPGRTVTGADVELRHMEVGPSQEPLTSFAQVSGTKTLCVVKKGQVLENNMLKTAPLVRSRQPVTLIVKGRNCQLQIECLALKDGSLGETVTVQNQQSRKTVAARVVCEGTVETIVGE